MTCPRSYGKKQVTAQTRVFEPDRVTRPTDSKLLPWIRYPVMDWPTSQLRYRLAEDCGEECLSKGGIEEQLGSALDVIAGQVGGK